jgi:GNAT superfamily N-acetyltransferase
MRPSVDAIPTRDIVDFALDPEQNLAADGSLIIDPLRARSLAANSFASSDDAALLVARAEGKSVGYIAVHWDRLHFRGADHRFAWGHQFFVVPEYRHLLCAMLLLRKSLSLADGWGAWGIAPDAAKICRALGCFEPVSIARPILRVGGHGCSPPQRGPAARNRALAAASVVARARGVEPAQARCGRGFARRGRRQ